MSNLPNCPQCNCEYTYEDGALYVCPECSYEWSGDENHEAQDVVRDMHGNVLNDGDTVSIAKDLKVKGSSSFIKQGTVVKNIKLIDEAGHNITGRVEGFGKMNLKSEFVKKS